MTHFVPIPPDPEFWVPKLTELSLFDKNGTASIAVWRMPPNARVRVNPEKPNEGFLAQQYRIQGDLTLFYLRGLVGGEEVAVFDPENRRQTAWLPIRYVAAAAKRPIVLPRSKHHFPFILDAYGAEQRHPPIKEADWLRDVEATIEKIKRSSVGRIVFDAIPGAITIRAQVSGNAFAVIPSEEAMPTIVFTPQGTSLPGNTPDETLLHELAHVVDNSCNEYVDQGDGLIFNKTEFFAITVTNVYANTLSRPLRADHKSFSSIPAFYAPTFRGVLFTGSQSFRRNHLVNFWKVKARAPSWVSEALAREPAQWNPFKPSPDE